MAESFQLSETPIDVPAQRSRLLSVQAGAYASFEGWVRDHNDGRAVQALSYEAYRQLATSEGQRVIDEAIERHGLLGAACVHRLGRLDLGEMAVWVGVIAAHRDAAFAGCRWIIDEVKLRVPIWKNEHYAQGDAAWLHPQARP